IADAMRPEYEAVARADFDLQVDCPDLGMGRHIQFADLSLDEFRRMARLHIEALNHALANVPPERSRLHVCWGNYEGPHHHDVAFADIIDVVLTARPASISFEAANPRHAHEWRAVSRGKRAGGHGTLSRARPATTSSGAAIRRHAHEWRLFERVKLPAGKVLIPGVIDSTTNFIEHPDLVAERIGRYARLVGRENVIAGTDCGFGTWVGQAAVDPDIVWAKLASMAEAARRATRELWKRGPGDAPRPGPASTECAT